RAHPKTSSLAAPSLWPPAASLCSPGVALCSSCAQAAAGAHTATMLTTMPITSQPRITTSPVCESHPEPGPARRSEGGFAAHRDADDQGEEGGPLQEGGDDDHGGLDPAGHLGLAGHALQGGGAD